MTQASLLDALFDRLLDRVRTSDAPASSEHKAALLGAVRASGWRPLADLRQDTRPRRPTSDVELAQAFQAGDAHAFDQLFARYHGKLIAYARKSGCPNDAEDLAQEAFTALVRTAPTHDPGFNVSAYLFTVVRYRAIKLGLRRAREPSSNDTSSELEDPAQDPLDQLIAQHGFERIVALLEDRCTPAEQTVLALTHQGQSTAEIAATLETTAGNVRVIHHRARTKLRAALDENPS